jgi:hypothetical protein
VKNNAISCHVGKLSDEGGKSDWDAIPEWAKAPHLRKYYDNNPRLLADHGLCNEKFKRLVVCGPGYDDGGNPNDPAHQVCQAVGKHLGY